ncbi:MAG TPA: T9SS type A sorting domain-containing protein [Cyclobacteriaceae bacterium]|nr:T9SS type A sorting domain-containing protein [Cyclobacteriaceae bacterium]
MLYIHTHWRFLQSWRIRFIPDVAIGLLCLFPSVLFAQEIIPEVNSFKTALPDNVTGDWDNPATWEIWNGATWVPTTDIPARTNDVFIEQAQEVRLTQNQEVRNLYLFSTENPGRKLNLQEFDLDVYGALRCYTDTTGVLELHARTSLLTDWIYPETGNIVFKGTSRIVVDRGSWSANNLRSRYGVVFNPNPGDTLTVNAGFKANSFTVLSGTVLQTVNSQGTVATSTFSFNTQDIFGSGAYGAFIIESGATLVSEGSWEFGEILRRSDNIPAAEFHLKEGGALVLYGQDPVIEAENVLLEGDVYYRADSGVQHFITSSLVPFLNTSYNNIFFDGEAVKPLPSYLELRGDLVFWGGGDVVADATQLDITGTGDQEILHPSLQVGNLQITKPSGTLSVQGDLSVLGHFTLNQGSIDFMGNRFFVNVSEEGSYSYYGGSWRNLSLLRYLKLPPVLEASNSTFPFEDQFVGGVRSIYLSGNNPADSAALDIIYHQVPDINWDPGFDDVDGAPIYYKTNSYFTLDLTGAAALTDSLSLYISGDNLEVMNEEDLRVVGNEGAAPGSNLPVLAGIFAGRAISFSDLNNSQSYTMGITGINSILPVNWLTYTAEELQTGNLIQWSTTKEVENARFSILKSAGEGGEFEEIGELMARGNSNTIQHYSYLEKSANGPGNIFYQVKYEDLDGELDFSPVFPLQRIGENLKHFGIFPNPHSEGRIGLVVPDYARGKSVSIQVFALSGKKMFEAFGEMAVAAREAGSRLTDQAPGTYLVIFVTDHDVQAMKWLKK